MRKSFGLQVLTRFLLLAILATFAIPSVPAFASGNVTIDFEDEIIGETLPLCSGAAGTGCHRASGTNLASWNGPGGLTYETVSSGYAQVDIWYLFATDGRYDGHKWVRFTAGNDATLQTVRLRSTDNSEFRLKQLKVRDASQSTTSKLTVKVKRDGAVVGTRTYQMSGQGNEIFSTDTTAINPWMESGVGENFDNIDTIEISGFSQQGFIIDSLQIGNPGPENQKPTGSFTINDGSETAGSRNVTLHVTGTDPESDPMEMRFSHDNGLWSEWEPFAATKAWTLTEGEGFKMVFMHLRDSEGNLANTAFKAVTLSIMYTVSFDKNGGDTDASPLTRILQPGEIIDELPAAPSRVGYTFMGWNTASNGTGEPVTAGTEVTADMTAYAQWQQIVPANAPTVTNATTAEDGQSSDGLVIDRNNADGTEVGYFKITAITGGNLFKNDGVTPIQSGDFITYAEGNSGLKFSPAPNANSVAGDSFSFNVQAAFESNGSGLSATVPAVITVTEVNDAPVAVDDILPDMDENTAQVTIPIAGLLANDSKGAANESSQELTLIQVEKLSGGEVRIDGSNVIFTPDANYAGPAQFRYTIRDNGTTAGAADPLESQAVAGFQIEARAAQPAVTNAVTHEDTQSTDGLVITAATSGGAAATHYKISGITGGKLYNNDGATLIPEGGFITVSEGSAGLKFTPDANAYGTDGFGFHVQGAPGTQGNRLSDAVPVTITVHEVNDAPQAADDVLADINEDAGAQLIPIAQLLGNDTKGADNENDQLLTVISVDQAVGGTVEIVESNIVFTPHANYHGAAGFRYTVQDNGTTAGLPDAKTDTANVSFLIKPVADVPSVTGATTAEDTLSDSGLVITRNAADGPEVTHFLIGNITGGTLYKHDGTTLLHNGSLITVPEGAAGLKFKPETDAHGETGFGFDVQASLDATGTSVSSSVAAVITVTEVNDAPVAKADTLDRVIFGTKEILIPFSALTANDLTGPANEAGQELTVTDVSQATGGTVSIIDGQIKFVPDSDFLGTASFIYEVTDNGTTNGAADPKSHSAQVDFVIGDATAPVITLFGENPLYLLVNESFVDPGFTAIDDADGDLTEEVAVTGSVTAGELGVYTLKYNVSDRSHNAAVEVTRQVHVVSNELQALSTSHGEIEPVFDPKETSYTLQLPYDVTSLDVTAVPLDPAAVVTINDQTIGDQGVQKMALNAGKNTLAVTVTAPSGSYTTYTLEVTLESPPEETSESPSGPVSGPAPAPAVEKLYVDVEAAGKGNVSQTEITRTTKTDGTKRDNVTFTTDKAIESAQKTVEAGSAAARIIIPDQKDEVSEVRVELPVQSLQKIADSKLGLELYTNNGMISIPNDSLQGLNGDVYFHIVPVKKEEERKQVEERAKKEEVVREALGDGSIVVVGRPMTIETNMTSRPVTITLPLLQTSVPADAQEREKFLAKLAVFIEHSDGERVLVKPEVVSYKENMYGLAFQITKFSTFTIVDMQNAHPGQNPVTGVNTHERYMNGYEDGTFKPEQRVTRAEMAAMLQRLIGKTGAAEAALGYNDVAATHWAGASIRFATDHALMDGYPTGEFKPEAGITRAEMAAVIARYKKLSSTGGAGFADVDGHWASQLIAQVQSAGYLKGYEDGTFRPEQLLTRAEAVTILNRVFNRGPLTGVTVPTWSDVALAHWAFGDIEEASLNHSYLLTEAGAERFAEGQ